MKKRGSRPKAARRIYQFKITLKGIKPAIWRRVQVWNDTPLDLLSLLILKAMGWEGYHLHAFTIGDEVYGATSEDNILGFREEADFQINQLVSAPKQKFLYEYDFGDGWVHEVILEKISAPEAGVTYPRCIGGANACPPEDCGGATGYQNDLRALGDRHHPEREHAIEILGRTFDPAKFNLEAADSRLELFRAKGKQRKP
jgi:hypothetical protein